MVERCHSDRGALKGQRRDENQGMRETIRVKDYYKYGVMQGQE